MDDDADRFGSGRNASVVAGIEHGGVAYVEQVVHAVRRRFDRHFPVGMRRRRRLRRCRRLVVTLVAEDVRTFEPGEVCRRFGHFLGLARQPDVASAADVHFRTALDDGL